jgi:hypothetical protein
VLTRTLPSEDVLAAIQAIVLQLTLEPIGVGHLSGAKLASVLGDIVPLSSPILSVDSLLTLGVLDQPRKDIVRAAKLGIRLQINH